MDSRQLKIFKVVVQVALQVEVSQNTGVNFLKM